LRNPETGGRERQAGVVALAVEERASLADLDVADGADENVVGAPAELARKRAIEGGPWGSCSTRAVDALIASARESQL